MNVGDKVFHASSSFGSYSIRELIVENVGPRRTTTRSELGSREHWTDKERELLFTTRRAALEALQPMIDEKIKRLQSEARQLAEQYNAITRELKASGREM